MPLSDDRPEYGFLRPSSLHRIIQAIYVLFLILVAVQFTLHAFWAMGMSDTFVSRPPAVEGFLPISAIMALKQLVATGLWDMVHPAGLTILLYALITGVILRKSFCGYICPIGTASNMLFHLGQKLGVTIPIPPRFAWLLTIPKYPLLALFLYLFFGMMDMPATITFLTSRYNLVCDTKMLLFFLHPSTTLLVALGLLVLGSVFIPSFWCRAFCPYGALLGILSLFSPVAVRRDADRCIGCRQCTHACPMGISVHLKHRVSVPECTGCLECVNACPKKHCLGPALGYTKKASAALPWGSIGIATVSILLAMWLAAVLSGHWFSTISREMIRPLHEDIEHLSHF